MHNYRGGDRSQAKNKDHGATQKVEFATQTLERVVMSEKKKKTNSEKPWQDETPEQAKNLCLVIFMWEVKMIQKL